MSEALLETWKNQNKGPIYVLKYDKFGNETHLGVAGGRSFSLTRDERLLNQDRAANENLDMFSNGMLTPVRLLDGDETAAELASNPNLMSEEDLKELFGLHWKTFNTRVSELSNAIVLHRLLDVAGEVDATVKQVQTLQERLKELDPTAPTEREVMQVGQIDDREGVESGDAVLVCVSETETIEAVWVCGS